MDSSTYKPDLDTLNKYFALPLSPFAVPDQRSVDIPDNPDSEFQPYLENMLEEVIDENLFQEIGTVLKKYFDQEKWTLPEGRISDFYLIVKNYLKATQSLAAGADKIAQTNLSERKENMKLLDILKFASKKNKVSIRLKVKLEDGSSETITPPASMQNYILSYFKELKRNIEIEDGDRSIRNITDKSKSMEEKPRFSERDRILQCKSLNDYLTFIGIQSERERCFIIGLLFSIADQPFNKVKEGKRVSLDHRNEGEFHKENVIDAVKWWLKKPI